MGIYLNSNELEAMVGIQHLQKLVYTHGIRPYMDFATGIVGIKRGISWQSISEALYVEPAPGIKGGSPKKHPIRTAVDGLIRAGLLQPMSTPKKLIFKCLLAETDISKKNKDGTKLAREVVTQKNVNRILVKVNSEANSSHGDRASKNVEYGTYKNAKGGTPPSIRDLKTSTSSESSPLQDDDDRNFIFSKKLSAQEISVIKKLLRGFDADASQILLDELAGHMAAKQINSPVGYFRTIIRDAKAGIFQPERAIKVAQGRKNELAVKKQMESSAASVTKNTSLSEAKKPKEAKFSISEKLKDLNKNRVSS